MNEELRAHVTRVGFDMTLGKTHIAALVYLDQCLRERRYIRTLAGHNVLSMWVPAIQGLQRRGLVVHQPPPPLAQQTRAQRAKQGKWGHLGGYYSITKAGRLVIGLLKEAGIWQEYLDTLPIRREEAS